MRPLLAFALCLLLAACGAASGVEELFAPDTPPGDEMTSGERDLALELLALINQARLEAEVPALIWDERAADAAYDHAVDMRLRSFYAHVNPDGLGPCERLMAKAIPMNSCGAETLARQNPTPQDAMDALMASSEHRAIILSPASSHVGVGVHTGDGGPWWVQDYFILAE